MSSQFLRLKMLFAFILCTVITLTHGSFEFFENELFKNALKSMIKGPLENESYQEARLLYAREIETGNHEYIWEISVSLNSNCNQEPGCPSKKCNIYVKGDEFSNISSNVPVNCSIIENGNYPDEQQYDFETRTDLFKNILCRTFLTSLIKDTLKNEVYTLATLYYAELIESRNGNDRTFEVSVVLSNYPVQQCQEKRCDIYFKQDESGELTPYDRPEECRCILNEDGSRSDQETVIGVPIRSFFGDPEIAHLIQNSHQKYSPEYTDAMITTSIINATEMNIENGKKYEIYYNLIQTDYELVGNITKDYTKGIINGRKQCKIEALYKDTCEENPIVSRGI